MNIKTQLNIKFREITSEFRMLPNFIIIGAQKAGTSSLFEYLKVHPQIAVPFKKEIHFFDRHYGNGINWYRQHFPLILFNKTKITYESSPYYLYDHFVPEKIKSTAPNVKIIVLLRDPIHRAYSHYNHNIKVPNREKLSFEEAIKSELSRMKYWTRSESSENDFQKNEHIHFSYLSRGNYYEQIVNWFKHFDKKKFLFINSETFFKDSKACLRDVYHFLGIIENYPSNIKIINKGIYNPKISTSLLNKLKEYFNDQNEKLFRLLGTDFKF